MDKFFFKEFHWCSYYKNKFSFFFNFQMTLMFNDLIEENSNKISKPHSLFQIYFLFYLSIIYMPLCKMKAYS